MNPKFAIGQRVEIKGEEGGIYNGIHFTVTHRKTRHYANVTEWCYTGPGCDDIYVSEELLISTTKLEGDE